VESVWELTRGQPWLVNAIGFSVTRELPEGLDRSRTVTMDMVLQAKENLIARRMTHIDHLANRLKEDRVRRVIQPVILGETSLLTATGDDIRYAEDLGLIRQTETGVEIANPIYQEVIPRLLTAVTEINLGATSKPSA